jgi:hypothetical protein
MATAREESLSGIVERGLKRYVSRHSGENASDTGGED